MRCRAPPSGTSWLLIISWDPWLGLHSELWEENIKIDIIFPKVCLWLFQHIVIALIQKYIGMYVKWCLLMRGQYKKCWRPLDDQILVLNVYFHCSGLVSPDGESCISLCNCRCRWKTRVNWVSSPPSLWYISVYHRRWPPMLHCGLSKDRIPLSMSPALPLSTSLAVYPPVIFLNYLTTNHSLLPPLSPHRPINGIFEACWDFIVWGLVVFFILLTREFRNTVVGWAQCLGVPCPLPTKLTKSKMMECLHAYIYMFIYIRSYMCVCMCVIRIAKSNFYMG